MVSLNDTGAFLWEKMTSDICEADLVSALLDEYEVSEEVASEDVRGYLVKMREANLIDE